MQRLFSYIYLYRWYYILAIIGMIISIGLDLINPQLVKILIDEVIILGNNSLFLIALLGLGIVTFSRGILGYVRDCLCDYGSQKIVKKMRTELFNHLQTLSFSFYDQKDTGELMSRIKEDIDNIWQAISFGAILFLEQVVYFFLASIILFTINWKLALIIMSFMPLIAIITIRLEKEISNIFSKISDQAAVVNTTAQENIAGTRLVKAFGREKYEFQKFLKENTHDYNLKMEQASIWSKYFPAIEFLSNVVIVLAITIGGSLVINDELTIGELVAFSQYAMMLIWPMRLLGWLTNLLAECRASVKKIDKLFQTQSDIKSPLKPILPSQIKGDILFEKVSLTIDGVNILKNISFEVKAGKTLAIMGMTGSGKTSILNLIPRFYDCSSGEIKIDGINVKKWPLKNLRQEIAMVMQETFLFSDTISANILLGASENNTKELRAALNDAMIGDFIQGLPQNLYTEIGEQGVGLSGGQKQRLAIARALYKKGHILILDDATSNLDMATEALVQKAIAQKKKLTKIIIAHRISAVKDADEIIILEQGSILERGNHQSLLAKKGRYYETYCTQYRDLIV